MVFNKFNMFYNMIKECEKYYLVEIQGVKTPIRHKYTNLHDEWLLPDGSLMTEDQVAEAMPQISESTRITDASIYQKLIDIYEKVKSISDDTGTIKEGIDLLKEDSALIKDDIALIKEDTAILKTNVSSIVEGIGDIKTVLDYINGEVV